jgi:hypothetical protein
VLRRLVLVSATALAVLGAETRSSAETTGTLTLDGLSFVSFEDEQVLPLTGGTIRFHFSNENTDGSVRFQIAPGDVSIPEISLSSGEVLRYGLASTASGTLRPNSKGHVVQFDAVVAATLVRGEEEGTLTYVIPFTTGMVSARSPRGEISATGAPVVPGARYVQLVGATMNKRNAQPKPDRVVYAVLSGTFDQLP